MHQKGSALVFVVIGAVAFLLITGVVVAVTLGGGQKQSQKEASPLSQSNWSENPSQIQKKSLKKATNGLSATPSAAPISKADWQVVQQDTVQIKIPAHWEAKSAPVIGGGSTIMLVPKGAGNDSFPRVDIQRNLASEKNLASVKQELLRFGFKLVGPTLFLGNNAERFHMELPGRIFVTGNPGKKDVMKDLYLFAYQGTVYQVDYAYYKDTDSVTVERTLKAIIDTLTF